jgi:4-hydroxybenzoate polyprenyltransferase
VNVAKVYTAVWLSVLIALLIAVIVYVLQFRWWLAVAYILPAIIFPLVVVLLKLKKAATTKDYHQLSTITKIAMFTGILSMLFFYFYL